MFFLLVFLLPSIQICNGELLDLNDFISGEYDRFSSPHTADGPAVVLVKITLINIRSIDESEMTYRAVLFLRMKWKDARLKFPENATVNPIKLDTRWLKKIWSPDVIFKNSLEGSVDEAIIPYIYLLLHKDLTISLAARMTFLFSCLMNLKRFPHDTQTCTIILQSLTMTRSQMELKWKDKHPVRIVSYLLLPQFDIVNTSHSTCHVTYSIGDFSCLNGTIAFKRRSGYYMINVYIPSTLIVLMSMLTFWIPPEAVPARITLGVTSLLTIVTKQYQSSLPSVSYIVALNIWMSSCIGFVFFSLVEYAVVISLDVATKERAKKLLGIPKPKHPTSDAKKQPAKEAWRVKEDKEDKCCTSARIIDRTSRVFFPLAFVFHCCAYGFYYDVFQIYADSNK